MAKTENDLVIEQMRQRLASAQAVLGMRGSGVVSNDPIIPGRSHLQDPSDPFLGMHFKNIMSQVTGGTVDSETDALMKLADYRFIKFERERNQINVDFGESGMLDEHTVQDEARPESFALARRLRETVRTIGNAGWDIKTTASDDRRHKAYQRMMGKMGFESIAQSKWSRTDTWRKQLAGIGVLPEMGSVPLPEVGSIPEASGAQQTALPEGMSAEELFRRKLGMENRGIPTSPLAGALAHHQANYRPPELPERMPIPQPEGQGSGWEVQRGLTREEQGEPDASQRQASVSGGAGSLFGNVGRSMFNVATSHFQSIGRMGRIPGGSGSFGGYDTGFSTRTGDGAGSDELKKTMETLIKSVDNLAKIMEQGKQSDQHGHTATMPGKPSSGHTQSPTKADKKSGIDPALIRQGAAVIARFIGMGR